MAQAVVESEVSPNPLLVDDGLVGPGVSFSQLGSTQSYYQLNFLDEVTGEYISYNSVAAENTTFASFELLSSDFNVDGVLDCHDVNALVAEIVARSHALAFDLTGDGSVDGDDLNQWRADAGAANLDSGNPYLLGDANLDGTVDGQDFVVWNANKFTATPAWCAGDFNADGTVDGQDFVVWNSNKFTSSDQVAQSAKSADRLRHDFLPVAIAFRMGARPMSAVISCSKRSMNRSSDLGSDLVSSSFISVTMSK